MTTDPTPPAEEQAPKSIGLLDGEGRQLAAACLAGAALGSWPAFTMGVYGVVFFEQHLSLWATATSVFLALGVSKGPRIWARPQVLALLLPSLWVVLAWILPVGGTSGIYQVLFWFGVVITVVGLPAMAAILVRLLIPGAERLRGKRALAAAIVVSLLMLVSFGLGTQHPRLLTCEDFTISGNYAPENCSPGTGSTVR
ncbi:hypothetical protein [Humibacillus xanthopallidus]|uniref:Uncharacterized protein n=1 Tax=Humibacillus xanthopallidus TaxID=412689 RepID=A0A543I252_9MICO|nr:hypothetical protein [Humibacillus xanthopallidus]TQM64664.1 hypothetical protein FBY41_1039 [Humibacillus xanthopallidus]